MCTLHARRKRFALAFRFGVSRWPVALRIAPDVFHLATRMGGGEIGGWDAGRECECE